jgi:hypothetical protein
MGIIRFPQAASGRLIAALNRRGMFGGNVAILAGKRKLDQLLASHFDSALAEIDTSRRTVAFAGVFVYAGLAAGPLVAAAIISEQSVRNVSWMGIVFSGLSFLLFGRILMRMERATVARSTAT